MQELLAAGIVKSIDFPTRLANLVVMPKHSREWRLCINYTDLNKTISKEPFPLPHIDQVVDVMAGHEVICLLDAHMAITISRLLWKVWKRQLCNRWRLFLLHPDAFRLEGCQSRILTNGQQYIWKSSKSKNGSLCRRPHFKI